MHRTILFPVVLSAALLGCNLELDQDIVDGPDTASDTDVQDDGPDRQQPAEPGALDELVEDARDDLAQYFTANPTEFTEIRGEEGTVVFLWPNSLETAEGELVEGDVEIELIEIYGKSSMLITDVPTNGLNGEGEVAQLVSGGEFYVNATQNGENLELNRSYMVIAPTENTGGPDMDMELFKMKEDGPDGKDLWVEAEPVNGEEQVDVGKGDADGGSGEYSFLTQEFGWSNIDRWYSDPRPKTTIHVDVPDGWDDENSGVFLSYDGENTLARFDTYDESTELFSEHYGLIPIGLEVHVIFMTESEGTWSYAIQQTTIVDNHVSVFDDPNAFIETDTDGLIAAIDALP